jgi:hypothetical protein
VKLRRATTVTLVLLAFWSVLTFVLFAIVGALGAPGDRPLILLIGLVGSAAVVAGRLIWETRSIYIPLGLAGVIVNLNQRVDACAGPVILHTLPLLQRVEYFTLLQKPLDLSGTYTTKDQIPIGLTLSIYYEITVDNVIPHLEKWIDVIGDLTRLVKSWLTIKIGAWPLDDIVERLPRFANELVSFLNQPQYNPGLFSVKRILFTEAKLPPEIIRAKTELKTEFTQLLVSKIRSDEHLVALKGEIDARVDELNKLAPTVGPVDARTFDLVELHTLLDHIENMTRK